MIFRPIAFQISNYKSIKDSGVCTFSGDGITVLAGQNEAGKTSILSALEDFNGSPGEPTDRHDIVPDDETDASPRVSMLLKFSPRVVIDELEKAKSSISQPVVELLQRGECWIERDLLTGQFSVKGELGTALDRAAELPPESGKSNEDQASDQDPNEDDENEEANKTRTPVLDRTRFCKFAFNHWPLFYYFDSFDDLLPRKVAIDKTTKIVAGVSKLVDPVLPKSVRDFLAIADIDLSEVRRLAALEDDEKQLRNYLSSKSATVTGDFLGYWKQRTGSAQTVRLRTEFSTRADGTYLLFYVDDGKTLQFADQRSRGFLWFLSFYISVAAGHSKTREELQSLFLIDEPGSFLHPKAQRDVLDVLQKRISQHNDLVVYSTHSPYLMPSEQLHRLRVAFKESNGKTVVADRLTDPRLRSDHQGDALAPVMASIGMTVEAHLASIPQAVFVVEGISDYYYLHAWAKVLGSNILTDRGIIVSVGTPNVPSSVSIALACSRNFVILLDRDGAGNAVADKLRSKMNISDKVIVQTKALMIEDLFDPTDFAKLVNDLDPKFTVDTAVSPSASIKKHSIDKVLLARIFAEQTQSKKLSKNNFAVNTITKFENLFSDLEHAISEDPVFHLE